MIHFDANMDMDPTFMVPPMRAPVNAEYDLLCNLGGHGAAACDLGALGTPLIGRFPGGKKTITFPRGILRRRTQVGVRRQMVAETEQKVARPLASENLRKTAFSMSVLQRQLSGTPDAPRTPEFSFFASHSLRIGHRKESRSTSIIKKSDFISITGPPLHSAGVKSGIPDEQTPPPTSRSCISLLLKLLRDVDQQTLVCNLSGSDAQLLADYLDAVSREVSALQSSERRRTLYLLCKLATSAQVFPRCYELAEIGYDTELVGGGGFSDVYKGTRGDQSVCLKIVRPCRKRDSDYTLKTALRELTLWAHLSHRNILPLYGICLLGAVLPRVCFVSPWMENGNLCSYLAKFPRKPRIPLISDIIEGLLHLHDLGIVHGDLKAENILVSDDGCALIADFGLSSIAASTNLVFVTPNGGTTHWMAPELLTGNSEVRATRACDIWSFACLCYEVFTSMPPFYQYKDCQVVVALMNKEVPLRPEPGAGGCGNEIDDRIWELLMECWKYTPQDRPSCETLRDFFKDMRAHDTRPKAVAETGNISARRQAMNKHPHTEIDYIRVEEILLRINASAIGPSPAGGGHGKTCYDRIISCWRYEVCRYYISTFLISSIVVFGFYSYCQGFV